MKIGPCKDEVAAHVVVLLLSLPMIVVFPIKEFEPNPDTVGAILQAFLILAFAALIAWSVATVVYYGRTITLDSEGCRFSFRGFEKKYRWEELDVQYYENDHSKDFFTGREANGPGILINVKGRKYNPKRAAMEYCTYFHPMTSVFLRFRQPTDERLRKNMAKTIFGYVIEREELLAVLKSFGQCPEVPES